MQPLLRTDIVLILDLNLRVVDLDDFVRRASRLGESTPNSRMLDRMNESFGWLFYDDQLADFELFDISSALRKSDPNLAGAVLRLNQRLRIGTFLLWRTHSGNSDPRDLKMRAWEDLPDLEAELSSVLSLSQDAAEYMVERFYPFVGIQIDTSDIDSYSTANAEEIGRVLTGDLEEERPAALRQYIETDLSRRSYEKLFIRWTEALALYSRLETEELYENTLFRAVQLFEHCVLARVALRSLAADMESFVQHLTVITPGTWARSRTLSAAFSNAEDIFVMYPHVQSVEANRLITAAATQFGLAKVLASAKAKETELRERFEWAKTQTLGLLAFLTYFFDKIIGWDNLRDFVARGFQRIF